MPIAYEDSELHVLTEDQESSFVGFVTGIWPGTAAGIASAELSKLATGEVMFSVFGQITVSTVGGLPPPPFDLHDIEPDGDYVFDHTETVQLTGGQIGAFANFLALTWGGSVGDVERVTFRRKRVSGGGFDILARINGTKTVATPAELPPPPVRIVAIT